MDINAKLVTRGDETRINFAAVDHGKSRMVLLPSEAPCFGFSL
jgi:hypothetical protein